MVACREYAERIQELVDQGDRLEAHPDLAAHLQACGACRADLRALQQMASLLAALPREEPRASFDEEVLARLALRRKPATRRAPAWIRIVFPVTRWERGLALAAVGLAALLVVAAGPRVVQWLAFGLGATASWASAGIADAVTSSIRLVLEATAGMPALEALWMVAGIASRILLNILSTPQATLAMGAALLLTAAVSTALVLLPRYPRRLAHAHSIR